MRDAPEYRGGTSGVAKALPQCPLRTLRSGHFWWSSCRPAKLDNHPRDGVKCGEAVVDGFLRLSCTELIDRIRCAAGAFASTGIDKSDRVAIWAPNSAEWIVAAFGTANAGAVLVPVNTRFKTAEATDIIHRSGAKVVLVEKGFLGQDFAVPADVAAT